MKSFQESATVRNGTNLEYAHLRNQRVVLDTVRLHEPISRTEIDRRTALSNQTVFNITDGLRRIGLIQDFVRKTTERGQPPKLFEINPDAAFSIGIHFERDHIASVLIDFKGVIRARTYRSGYPSTPDEALKQALGSIRELKRKSRRRRIWGLGVASPGPMDFREDKVICAPNFPGWEQVH